MLQKSLNNFIKLVIVIIGMLGFRVERLKLNGETKYLPITLIWAAGFITSFIFTWIFAEKLQLSGVLIYFGASWIYYYIGNTLILTTNFRFKVIDYFGEETAYRLYEAVIGLMFANQALAFGAIVEETWFGWPAIVKLDIVDEIGLLFIAIGFVVKTWATLIVGLDIYYYKDMFLSKVTGSFAVIGPYKLFDNPMYGIGNLQLYGFALFYLSLSGLFFAFIIHTSIYAFYYYAEKPAVVKLYGEAVSKR